MGISSEDEAEGLDPEAGVALRGQTSRVGKPEGVAPTPVGEDEVLVKKQALWRVKQQVSSLLRGEDLPEGAEARKVAEVPYQLPAVERDATVCPVCERALPNHHKLMKHDGGTPWRKVSMQQMWQDSGLTVYVTGSPTSLHPREIHSVS